MASIRERIETVFAAMAFAESDLDKEARELLSETRKKDAPVQTARRDTRPRVRV